jgi:hypothetical protein
MEMEKEQIYPRGLIFSTIRKIKREHPDFFRSDHMPWSIGSGDYIKKLYPQIDRALLNATLNYITKKKKKYLQSFLVNEYRYNIETQTHCEAVNKSSIQYAVWLMKWIIRSKPQAAKVARYLNRNSDKLLQNKELNDEDRRLIHSYISLLDKMYLAYRQDMEKLRNTNFEK